MAVLLIGLSHHTTPVDLREQFHLADYESIAVLRDIVKSVPQIQECVVLSTCNRFELYAVVQDVVPAGEAALDYLCQMQQLPVDELRPYFYTMQDRFAVAHLMRVASGLDSMILGEPQILGQVGQALEMAQSAATAGAVLQRLFSDALHTGKRARTETAISQHSTSVSHAAALLVKQQMDIVDDAHVLIVGVGEMAELAAEALQMHGISQLGVINRTYPHARAFAQKIDGIAYEWSRLWELMTHIDIVITATGAPHPILYADDIRRVMGQREAKPLLLVDVAVPRDIDPAVDQLSGVIRHDIDDLQRVVDDNLAHRRECIPQVEAIITQEEAKYFDWLNGRTVAPIITELRRKVKAMAEEEVRHALNRLGDLPPNEQAIVERLANRIVNKLLHEPTVRLKSRAANGEGEIYAGLVRELFALNERDSYV